MRDQKTFDCALLAQRHSGLSEGVRGLLETLFRAVVIVADEPSLLSTAARLQPTIVVADLSLVHDGSLSWMCRLRECCPDAKLLVFSRHDEERATRAAIEHGADVCLPTRAIATDLLPAIESILQAATH